MRRKLIAILTGTILAAGTLIGVAAPSSALSPGVSFAASDLPTWQTNGIVWAMAESNGVMYVGGTFTAIRPPKVAAGGAGSVSAVNFAALDAYTGNPAGCSLSVTGGSATVRALDVSPDGRTLYIGGSFTAVNGVGTTKLAAVNLPSCTVNTNFKPAAVNTTVRAIEATASAVYFGGDFKTVGSAARNRLAAVSTTGTLLPWAPSADQPVRALHVPAGRNIVLAGGDFLTMNGADSKALAVLNNTTGGNIRTYPNFFIPKTSTVKSIDSDATSFYIGNEGTGGGVFDGRARLDLTTYNQVWRDTCLGATQAVAVYGTTLYAAHHAHDCSSMNSFPDGPRVHLSAQSINGPSPMYQWNPITNDGQGEKIGPRTLAHTSAGSGRDILWTGGEFTTVNGAAQQSLTRFGPGPGTAGPGVPQFVSAESRASGQNTIRWQSTSDPDDSELTYRVYRNGSATPLATVNSSSRWWDLPQASFTDTTAVPGTAYTYRVQATDPSGRSGALSAQVQITTATSAAAYPALVRADGATTYWRLGDSLAAAADSSNGNKMGLPNLGAKPSGSVGALRSDNNRAASFDGVDDMIYGQQRVSAPTVFSAEAWFKTDTTTGGKILGFGNAQPRRNGTFLGYSSVYDRHVYMNDAGNLVFGTWSGTRVVVTSPARYNDDAWHHVVATQGPAGMVLYVDGVKVASNTVSANTVSLGSWRIGGDSIPSSWPNAPTSRHFKGAIDEFAVYPTALTAAQVAAHNQQGRR
ncbi:LamG domain-containing protein [Arthrobacter zhaoxinii]|uniref:LamG domain-containing protein n=1 Tax=Arthrobacter zhaoxinii TaxID=2964616 RepID=A0ABY5YUR8_9MICC|nr:LamG-like jellyroll fold domain-containing protein [Arthrobacter zhaoxinii]UWX97981.1 LamG domain-containing protein [Arthrobacter zhaoxinii]